MRFLLDTNICIYIIKKKPAKVLEKFQTLDPSDVGVSSITVAELEYGAYKSQRLEQNRAALSQFLLPLQVLPFDEKETQTYGQVRAELERRLNLGKLGRVNILENQVWQKLKKD
ncbi:type II toxin-antitoxin system VapC family toxin [Argonema galeatum]|uniref:type II toxin-antitoxin system VapC family toxin n=1 Tax=Argonema galeatum TaxID=2942762 RepID=UPI002013532E|nr:type II toxin-antitoxin system VapC family toxin [Argonema galeatum]MCL1464713.1 type II toxin-antitoxin system VapC family toxin [Argonema galeatum A003/A1]